MEGVEGLLAVGRSGVIVGMTTSRQWDESTWMDRPDGKVGK